MRFQIERFRNRIGEHRAAALADVLDGDADDEAMIFDGELDLGLLGPAGAATATAIGAAAMPTAAGAAPAPDALITPP